MRTIRPATRAQASAARMMLIHLRHALKHAVEADCPKTADRIRAAITSADGAVRHIDNRVTRAAEQQPAA